MRQFFPLLCFLVASIGSAQVEFVPETAATAVFSGPQKVRAIFRNIGAASVDSEIRFRLYQASASTLVPVAEVRPFKTVHLSEGQTVLEDIALDLPAVRGETVFHIAWFDGDRRLGSSRCRVFPNDLLHPLASFADDKPLAILDPEERLKPAFRSAELSVLSDIDDLARSESTLFIIAPISPDKRPSGLVSAIKRKAVSGAGIIWIQASTPEPPDSAAPVHVVAEGEGRIVLAHPSSVAHFAQSPLAQLNLVWMAELATGRRNLQLPSDSQP